ncbi:hypothetical protein FHS29_006158 [Saccharothrix tamanrassetensis]|uniref:Uncharacterized protein n=1 Tax=Saccharothrix tamanrassetensis TaxID=1051531 RepID=A0A841CU34_9PSEU|nr:hypothetical protein [Saccharothrix tamanrassetensis]
MEGGATVRPIPLARKRAGLFANRTPAFLLPDTGPLRRVDGGAVR